MFHNIFLFKVLKNNLSQNFRNQLAVNMNQPNISVAKGTSHFFIVEYTFMLFHLNNEFQIDFFSTLFAHSLPIL